jgi:hypothetical protein
MMKNRCLNPNAEDFRFYGARGITVPKSWMTYEGFVTAMGLRPEGMTLDRIRGSLSYSKRNCRWASRRTQARNREYTLDLTYGGRTLKVWVWAAILDIKPQTLHHRLWRHKNGEITLAQVFSTNPRSKA